MFRRGIAVVCALNLVYSTARTLVQRCLRVELFFQAVSGQKLFCQTFGARRPVSAFPARSRPRARFSVKIREELCPFSCHI